MKTWGMAAWVAGLLGAAAAGAADLRDLRSEYDRRNNLAEGPILAWATNQLHALQLRAQQAGNLNLAMAARREIGTVIVGDAWTSPPDDGTPPDVAAVRRNAQQRYRMVMAPVWGWYRQQLDALRRTLTQQGRMEEAAQIDGELTKLAAASADPSAPGKARGAGGWQTPWGGQVEVERNGVVSLKGPGKAAEQCAIAVSPVEWEKDAVLQCDIRVNGQSGGVVLCQDGHETLVLYWVAGACTLARLSHNGAQRVALPQPPLKWKPGEWQDLVVEKGDREFAVRLDKSSALIEAPPGLRAPQWGLIVHYAPSAVEIRNVRIGPRGPAASGPGRRR